MTNSLVQLMGACPRPFLDSQTKLQMNCFWLSPIRRKRSKRSIGVKLCLKLESLTIYKEKPIFLRQWKIPSQLMMFGQLYSGQGKLLLDLVALSPAVVALTGPWWTLSPKQTTSDDSAQIAILTRYMCAAVLFIAVSAHCMSFVNSENLRLILAFFACEPPGLGGWEVHFPCSIVSFQACKCAVAPSNGLWTDLCLVVRCQCVTLSIGTNKTLGSIPMAKGRVSVPKSQWRMQSCARQGFSLTRYRRRMLSSLWHEPHSDRRVAQRAERRTWVGVHSPFIGTPLYDRRPTRAWIWQPQHASSTVTSALSYTTLTTRTLIHDLVLWYNEKEGWRSSATT